MRAHLSLKDIAAKTGFSIMTVSRALNDHPDVKTDQIPPDADMDYVRFVSDSIAGGE